MCGICGIYYFNDDQEAQISDFVKKMRVSMNDRGPDHTSTWEGDGIILGHTRLAIMDPESEVANQPVQSRQWALVFNGEIYNFRQLRKELENKGIIFYSNSDTEVLINLIEVYGIDETLNRINGIFAFCAYDKLSRKVYLARDRLGIKPLYYWLDNENGHFWFASNPAAIANAAGKTWKLNYSSVFSFFHLGAPLTRATFFSGIERLRAAESMVIDSNLNIVTKYYWSPSYREGNIEEQIVDSILGEKESHVDSAIFLSGGIDSSLMTEILSDVEGFHLFSPELKYAQYVANHVGINLKVREYTNDVSFDKLLEIYSISSGEASASSPIPLMISQLIVQEGYKVAFSANGADELFFGYPRTPVPELLPQNYTALDYETLSVKTEEEQFYHIFRDERSIKIPNLTKEINKRDIIELYDIRGLDGGFPASAANRWFELQTYVGGDLNPTLDFASMACSLEVRVSFLDYKLVELALSHDGNLLISSDYGRKLPLKRILKQRGFHPALWSRHKVGFSIPSEVMTKREKSIEGHMKELKSRRLFQLGNSNKNSARDYTYLKSAAHAFNIWARVWMDNGKVVA